MTPIYPKIPSTFFSYIALPQNTAGNPFYLPLRVEDWNGILEKQRFSELTRERAMAGIYKTVGFLPTVVAVAEEGSEEENVEDLVTMFGDNVFFHFVVQSRILPKEQIKETVRVRAEFLERKEGRALKRNEKDFITEQVTKEFAVDAPLDTKTYLVIVNLKNRLVHIGANSSKVSEKVLSSIRYCFSSFPVVPIAFNKKLAYAINDKMLRAFLGSHNEDFLPFLDIGENLTLKRDDSSEKLKLIKSENINVIATALNEEFFFFDAEFYINEDRDTPDANIPTRLNAYLSKPIKLSCQENMVKNLSLILGEEVEEARSIEETLRLQQKAIGIWLDLYYTLLGESLDGYLLPKTTNNN